jgi:hypothetical protein
MIYFEGVQLWVHERNGGCPQAPTIMSHAVLLEPIPTITMAIAQMGVSRLLINDRRLDTLAGRQPFTNLYINLEKKPPGAP